VVFATAMSRNSVKKIFNNKVKELNGLRCNTSVFLDNERYDNIKREVEEAKLLRKNNQPLTSKHYQRLKRYEVIKSVIRRNLMKVVQAKMMIQTFVITSRWRSCLISWKQHISTQGTEGQEVRHYFVCD
jgi:hypothetical protein